MKKMVITAVALPLICLGGGYGVGATLAPTPVESPATTEDVKTTEVVDDTQMASETPEMDARALSEDRTILRLGQMTIPVEKPESVTYVVADFALKLETMELAERYKRVEEATRIRDSLLTAMNLAAESAVLRGVSIDSDALSALIRDLLSKDYAGIDDVLFVSLYKHDIARL